MDEMKNAELNEQDVEKVAGGAQKRNGGVIYGIPFMRNGVQMYQVGKGDMLSYVALYFGTTYMKIYEANRKFYPELGNTVLDSPSHIEPGWCIRIY